MLTHNFDTATPPEKLANSLHRSGLSWVVLVILLAGLYGTIFAELLQRWWNDSNYSHGFLVPLAAVYFGWRKKDILAALQPRPSLWGLPVLMFSQAVLLVGSLGAEYFLQRFSFVLLLTGGVLFLYGGSYLRVLAFPLAFLILMIPLPAIIFNAIAGPLQLVASQWAESLLRVCAVPVYRDGNILILSHQALNVTEACSGIRSLVSLFTLAIIVAYFQPFSVWVRGLLVLSALPITLLTNSLRVSGTGLLGQWWGPGAAEGFFHTFSGWLVFLLALVLLFSESMIIERWQRWRQNQRGN